MANFTKKAIRETFVGLLREKPFSEITVKDIVDRCEINRNTFYYHYRDLKALIEELLREQAAAIIREYPSVSSIAECFDAVTGYAAERKKIIMHLFLSVSRESFERSLTEVCDYFVRTYVDTALAEVPIGEPEKATVISYYRGVCFGLIMEWLNRGMSDSFRDEIRRIFLMKKDFTGEMAALYLGLM